jgi:hypothetical protein
MPQPGAMPNLGAARNFPTLYVGDLDEAINEEMLYNFFINYGPIYSVRIMRDLQNKKSRGFAYLSYYNLKDGTIIIYPSRECQNQLQPQSHLAKSNQSHLEKKHQRTLKRKQHLRQKS